MLKLNDFFHLPQIAPLLERLIADAPGLIVVAGFDPPALATTQDDHGFLPSGRMTLFRVLLNELLIARAHDQAIVVTADTHSLRVPDQFQKRVAVSAVRAPQTYVAAVEAALRDSPDLLVVDRLDAAAQTVVAAARAGRRVLAQFDTVFRGAAVLRHLRDLGATADGGGGPIWVIAVQRQATLCPKCKRHVALRPDQRARLRRFAQSRDDATTADLLDRWLNQTPSVFEAPGCDVCHGTGRQGEVASFDVFRTEDGRLDVVDQLSLLSLEAYLLELVALGQLSLDDVLHLDGDQLRRTYTLLSASARALSDANGSLQRKLVELESANQVSEQRTNALVSLQEIGEALISLTSLADLVSRVCRYACDLGGADRAILYLIRANGSAEVLAVSGWDRVLLHQQVDLDLVCSADPRGDPTPFDAWPPGITVRHPDVEGAELRAGLCVPLIAQGQRVGAMIVHTTRKKRFAPAEVALLRAFANQAALSIQRAALIDQLHEKITQLETAQADVVAKERLEREMELARQVQQSMLPRVFPVVPSYAFAAHSQPASQVGGDFYDIFMLDEHCFGVVIGDVSGKGMPAALYMALSRSLLLAEARREASPRAVLLNVNRLLRELGEPYLFVTVFYAAIDVVQRRLTYARAGHDYPLLARTGTMQSLNAAGTFLGFLDPSDLTLVEEQIDLLPGDRLMLYTDGMTDVQDTDNQLFGLKRLEALLQSHAHLDPAELCAATFADLAAYQGQAEQYDDMTLLVIGLND